ncbi:MAG: adenylyltransferase/cytidyltransferase family protein [bacterium]
MDIKKKKIMMFGTFDGIHEGHINLFKQARNFIKNSFLIVSIARGENVLKIKGYSPVLSDMERKNLLKKSKLADKVVLSGKKNYLLHILKEKPDVIALGYDQTAYVDNLKKDLKENGLIVEIIRLKPYKENIYKNHLLKK